MSRGPLYLLISVIFLFWSMPTVAQNDPKKDQSPPNSLEYMLAVVDFGYVDKGDIRIARFRSLLEQLSATFVESPGDIAGMTTKAKQMLEEKGISEKMLNMMEGMNRLFAEPFPNQRYSEYMGLYVVVRNDGATHEEAIEGLNSLLEAFGIR